MFSLPSFFFFFVFPTLLVFFFFFFFNDTATTEIYTLSLHDALPICGGICNPGPGGLGLCTHPRSEEHTSELQSRPHLVCRLLLEKKKKNKKKVFVVSKQKLGYQRVIAEKYE